MGTALHWPDVDEDIGFWTLLGVPEDLALEAAGLRRQDQPTVQHQMRGSPSVA